MPRELKHIKMTESARTPTRAHHDDAGFDLYTSVDTIVRPHEFVDVPTGVAMELPSDVWGMLTGRSSTLRKLGLLVIQGVIDPGYRGELFVGVWNLTDHSIQVLQGDRLGQLIILPNTTRSFQMLEVEQLGEHARGTAGFGSSGR